MHGLRAVFLRIEETEQAHRRAGDAVARCARLSGTFDARGACVHDQPRNGWGRNSRTAGPGTQGVVQRTEPGRVSRAVVFEFRPARADTRCQIFLFRGTAAAPDRRQPERDSEPLVAHHSRTISSEGPGQSRERPRPAYSHNPDSAAAWHAGRPVSHFTRLSRPHVQRTLWDGRSAWPAWRPRFSEMSASARLSGSRFDALCYPYCWQPSCSCF